ncbi:MAG: family 20 glycosylhydrolase [Bacteroidota bacterium]
MNFNKTIYLLLSLFVLENCAPPESSTEAIIQPFSVVWTLEKNAPDDTQSPRQFAEFELKNNGSTTITNNWAIYFNQISGPISGATETGNAIMEHINGDFYRLLPADNFILKAGESVSIKYKGANWAIKNSDAPAGLYVLFEAENGQTVTSVKIENYTLTPFETEAQLTRLPNDKFPIPTYESRYAENAKLSKLNKSELLPLIPSPKVAKKESGDFIIDNNFSICYFGELKSEADFLTAKFDEIGWDLPVYDGGSCTKNAIKLMTSSAPIEGKSSESYQIRMDAETGMIEIQGTDAAGVFYGIQSLLSLLPNEVYAEKLSEVSLANWSIFDAPRFGYRGLMLDVSRNFHSKQSVKKLLDLMATYKLNKFHFHLTDDEGWRLEIPNLPELTDIGAVRGHTLDEQNHLQPAYGSGPLTESIGYGGSGFYTVEDYVDIVRYAAARHIEVIPEIDLPGHARSAIIPMRQRYERLIKAGKTEEANEYLLDDANDASEYKSVQSYNDNVINVCQPSTYRFITKVVDELVEMHKTAGAPLRVLHTGGDEVPAGVWLASPECKSLLEKDKSIENTKIGLTTYFLEQFSTILSERGLVTAGWEEIGLELAHHGAPRKPNTQFVDKNFRPYVWNSIFGWGGEDIAYQLANLGYEVVLSNASNLYFDLAYDKDPENAGLYWAGFVNTRSVYDFTPLDLFKTAQMGRFGEEIDRMAIAKGKTKLQPAAVKNILGIQGQLWSEALINPERLELATFPKLLGLSERGWATQPDWATQVDESKRFASLDQDWNQFSNMLGQKEMDRLDHLQGGVGYYIPPPGAKVEDGKLYANTAFPGLTIRYTTDGTEPTLTSTVYTQPISIDQSVRLKVFSEKGHSSRSVVVKKGLEN